MQYNILFYSVKMPRSSGDIIILILNYFQRLGIMVDIIVHVTRCTYIIIISSLPNRISDDHYGP